MLKLGVIAVCVLLVLLRPSQGGLLDDSTCKAEDIHDYYFGSSTHNDKLVFMDHPKKRGFWLRKQSEDIVYPPEGEVGKRINYIEVTDHYDNDSGKGGCVFIKNGGIGQKFVTLHVKSQRSEGYDFVIKIYSDQNDFGHR